jgi:hypothetical protein
MATSTSKIEVTPVLYGQDFHSYITITKTDEGLVPYGTFPTLDEAMDWAKKLDNATIVPVYYPAYNRG